MKIIIDCHNLGHIVSYGMGGLSYNDRNTGVIFGFLKKVLELAEKFETNQFLFCWDSPHSYRKIMFPDYKRFRHEEKSIQELGDLSIMTDQFNQLRKEILPRLGFKNIFYQNGYEADDLIAEIVYRHPDKYIVFSSDGDLWQLLYEGIKGAVFVRILNPRTKKLFTENDFMKGWGIPPREWAFAKSIAGDPGDGVPGIKGVGLLGATSYIRKELSGRKLELIESEEGQDMIQRNLLLVALPFAARRRIQIDYIQEDEVFRREPFEWYFQSLGFKSFLKDFYRWEKAFNFKKRRKLL